VFLKVGLIPLAHFIHAHHLFTATVDQSARLVIFSGATAKGSISITTCITGR
jgi:hypothetical protein